MRRDATCMMVTLINGVKWSGWQIGCGSGFTAAALGLAAPAASFVIATDISPDAAATTRATLAEHGVQADIVRRMLCFFFL